MTATSTTETLTPAQKAAATKATEKAAYDARVAKTVAIRKVQDARDEAVRVQTEQREEAEEQRAKTFRLLPNPTPAEWAAEAKALGATYDLARHDWLVSDDYRDDDMEVALKAETDVLHHHLNWSITDPEGYATQVQAWAEAWTVTRSCPPRWHHGPRS